MEVILQKDIKALGKKGQKVTVSDGYARNYLMPRSLAIEASASNINTMITQDAAKAYHKQVEFDAALEQKKKLESAKITIKTKLGQNGKIFGAITSKEIAEELFKATGAEIDKKKISLSEPIKAAGEYSVDIRLYTDVNVKINLTVTAEE